MRHELEPDDLLWEVATELAERAVDGLPMLIGARARDVLHTQQGHLFGFTATHDIDMTLAVASWPEFTHIVNGLQPIGDSGVMFRVAGAPVDILPFGDVEAPSGTLTPPWRPTEPIDVFAVRRVFESADEMGPT